MSIFSRLEPSVPEPSGQTEPEETTVPPTDGQTDGAPEPKKATDQEPGETETAKPEGKDQPGQTEDGKEEEPFEMPEKLKGKSAEEIARSYVELEKLRERQVEERVQEEIDRIKREQEEEAAKKPQVEEEPSPEEQIDPEEFNRKFEEDFMERPADTVAQLTEVITKRLLAEALAPFKPLIEAHKAQQMQMTVNESIAAMERKYPDFNANIQNVEAILKSKPDLQKLPPQEALEVAYKLHLAESLPKEREKIEADVKKKLEEKKNAYVSGAKGGSGTGEASNPIEEQKQRLARPREPIFKL